MDACSLSGLFGLFFGGSVWVSRNHLLKINSESFIAHLDQQKENQEDAGQKKPTLKVWQKVKSQDMTTKF